MPKAVKKFNPNLEENDKFDDPGDKINMCVYVCVQFRHLKNDRQARNR